MLKTMNRGTLGKLIQKGRITHMVSYGYDETTGERISWKELPVQIGEYSDHKEGTLTIYPSDLKTKSGMAYFDEERPEEVTLIVHGNLNYTLRIKP